MHFWVFSLSLSKDYFYSVSRLLICLSITFGHDNTWIANYDDKTIVSPFPLFSLLPHKGYRGLYQKKAKRRGQVPETRLPRHLVQEPDGHQSVTGKQETHDDGSGNRKTPHVLDHFIVLQSNIDLY